VVVGLAIQVAFAALVLRWSVGRDVLDFVAGQVTALIEYADDGVEFLFGKLVADKQETIFALQVLPVIIFLGALVGLLYFASIAIQIGSIGAWRRSAAGTWRNSG
jgi:CNT family concentrative nucleoside transporter